MGVCEWFQRLAGTSSRPFDLLQRTRRCFRLLEGLRLFLMNLAKRNMSKLIISAMRRMQWERERERVYIWINLNGVVDVRRYAICCGTWFRKSCSESARVNSLSSEYGSRNSWVQSYSLLSIFDARCTTDSAFLIYSQYRTNVAALNFKIWFPFGNQNEGRMNRLVLYRTNHALSDTVYWK